MRPGWGIGIGFPFPRTKSTIRSLLAITSLLQYYLIFNIQCDYSPHSSYLPLEFFISVQKMWKIKANAKFSLRFGIAIVHFGNLLRVFSFNGKNDFCLWNFFIIGCSHEDEERRHSGEKNFSMREFLKVIFCGKFGQECFMWLSAKIICFHLMWCEFDLWH
jgi:hypothetical protein